MDISTLMAIDPFNWPSLLTALACGTVIGLERQLRGKPVGIRTSALIVIGTYVFVAASYSVGTGVLDPSRIIGQVVTGIGFLGAGVMLTRDGTVFGVTSAATIWSLAAIGVVIATSSNGAAIKLSILVFLILYGVDVLEDTFSVLTKGVHRKLKSFRAGDPRL